MERQPFPAWLRELCYFGGLIVMLAGFLFTLRSDQHATRSKVDEMSARLAAVEAKLPNKEAEELKYKMLEDKVDRNRSDTDFAVAKIEKWMKETERFLIKKGVID